MAGNSSSHTPCHGAQKFVLPYVIHLILGNRVDTQGPRIGSDGGGFVPPVEEDGGNTRSRVREWSAPHLTCPVYETLVSLDPQWVLVDGDGVGVCEDAFSIGGHVNDIAADEERRLHETPETEVGLIFRGRHPSIPHLKHVRVVPSIGPCVQPPLIILVSSIDHGLPLVRDITSGSPTVTHCGSPHGWIVLAPLTQRVKYRPSSIVQGLLHDGIAFLGSNSVVVTVVVFEVVDFPLGVGLGVLGLVREGAGSPRTRLVPSVAVQTEEEALGVNVVYHSLEIGESGGIGLNEAVLTPRASPAVVHVHVLVAELREVVGDECVGRGLDDSLVDAAVIVVPGVPAHLGRPTKAVVVAPDHRGQEEHADQEERSWQHLSSSYI